MTHKKENVSGVKQEGASEINLANWLLPSFAESSDKHEGKAGCENFLMHKN